MGEDFKNNVEKKIYFLKNSTEDIKIFIKDNNSKQRGFLRPLRKTEPNKKKIISLLSKWRSENQFAFPTRFNVTEEGTLNWYDHNLIKNPNRILFMIYNLKQEPIGHIGLSNFNNIEKSCEIDNVVRGVKNNSKGIMTLALNTLIKWTFNNLKIKELYLRVLSDNQHAISFYEKNNFEIVEEIPLEKIEENNTIRYEKSSRKIGKFPDNFFLKMKYIKSSNLNKSFRTKNIIKSEIRTMSNLCDEIKGINLSQGICDVPVPKVVKEGAKRAIEEGFNQYSTHKGFIDLRKVICKKLKNYNNIYCKPENVIVSNGATGAFYSACMAILNPGDEVVLFQPYYKYHINTIFAVGGSVRIIRSKFPNEEINFNEVINNINGKTKAILICTPSNPSGKVYTKKELTKISEIAIKYNLFILTDEIYEYILYDGLKHVSPGSISKTKDRTISIFGYSKTFSITGWRIGYCVAPKKYAESIGYINDLIYVCAPTPLQKGVKGGIENLPTDYYDLMKNEYEKKRNKLCDVLNEIGLKPHIPKGAYYVLADASILPGDSSKEKSLYLLKKTKIATVPGSEFFTEDKPYLRFCFAKKNEDLNKACVLLKKLKGELK